MKAEVDANFNYVPSTICKFNVPDEHVITLTADGKSFATVDGVAGDVIATTTSPEAQDSYRYLAFRDELKDLISADYLALSNSADVSVTMLADKSFAVTN